MMQPDEFKKQVWAYYKQHGRSMPWRTTPTPYHVLVSEFMLQQTQVSRVVPKFNEFIQRFPNITTLANAPLGDVLTAWSSLGYNRRAKYLWQASQTIQTRHNGEVPQDLSVLVQLPGIGPNTAGAILAYAYNQPVVFIETNIRTVFIHHFFNHSSVVADADIKKLVESTLPKTNVRDWYYALMDYGTHIKATVGSGLQKVRGYKPQSQFAGSLRQVRGQVLRLLVNNSLSLQQLRQHITDPRLDQVITTLVIEGLIHKQGRQYKI